MKLKRLTPNKAIGLRRSTLCSGYGVFAQRPIREGEVIELAPVLFLPADEKLGSVLDRYVFIHDKGKYALVLGYGSLYNHSFSPNAYCEDGGPRLMAYKALCNIRPGEEITINYNGEPTDPDPWEFGVEEDSSWKKIKKSLKKSPSKSQ